MRLPKLQLCTKILIALLAGAASLKDIRTLGRIGARTPVFSAPVSSGRVRASPWSPG